MPFFFFPSISKRCESSGLQPDQSTSRNEFRLQAAKKWLSESWAGAILMMIPIMVGCYSPSAREKLPGEPTVKHHTSLSTINLSSTNNYSILFKVYLPFLILFRSIDSIRFRIPFSDVPCQSVCTFAIEPELPASIVVDNDREMDGQCYNILALPSGPFVTAACSLLVHTLTSRPL